ncbi:MAG: hypothetical protein ACI96P_001008, partial [Candidatus Azotimanducaceae bacterium]
RMTDRGAKETAKRMANVMRRVYNDILILGIVDNNPAQDRAFAGVSNSEMCSIKTLHLP